MLLAEGVPGTVGPPDGRKLGTIAGVAITQQRLAVYLLGEPLIDVTWDSGDATDLDITAGEKGLEIAFDGERFAPGRTGRVELLLRIGDAAALLAAIDQRRRPLEPRRRLER